MSGHAADLAGHLARDAEAVCRYYLPKGRRSGRYWIAGDVQGDSGRSLYVRLTGPTSGPGAAGHWTDAATGEHGDLLDLIAANRGCRSLAETLDEARHFLRLPRPARAEWNPRPQERDVRDAARRMFLASRPLPDTLAEIYLRTGRGIAGPIAWPSLRFHPALWYRAAEDGPRQTWPALVAAVTDLQGNITGVQRTWLDPHHPDKAPVTNPRRALGELLGHGVRFGKAGPVLVAGEGIETMLALQSALPGLPMVAALSAAHLAALLWASELERLYVAADHDAAGRDSAARLHSRGEEAGIDVRDLVPRRKDFNDDLRAFGPAALRRQLLPQLSPADRHLTVGPTLG